MWLVHGDKEVSFKKMGYTGQKLETIIEEAYQDVIGSALYLSTFGSAEVILRRHFLDSYALEKEIPFEYSDEDWDLCLQKHTILDRIKKQRAIIRESEEDIQIAKETLAGLLVEKNTLGVKGD
jgi:hypothetical protein